MSEMFQEIFQARPITNNPSLVLIQKIHQLWNVDRTRPEIVPKRTCVLC